MIIAFWIAVGMCLLLLALTATVPPAIAAWREWRWRRAHRHRCFGCGNDARIGPHGMSEYGGCV